MRETSENFIKNIQETWRDVPTWYTARDQQNFISVYMEVWILQTNGRKLFRCLFAGALEKTSEIVKIHFESKVKNKNNFSVRRKPRTLYTPVSDTNGNNELSIWLIKQIGSWKMKYWKKQFILKVSKLIHIL